MQNFAQKPVSRRGLLGGAGAVAALGVVASLADAPQASAAVNSFTGEWRADRQASLISLHTRNFTTSDVSTTVDLTIWAPDSTVSDSYTVYLVDTKYNPITATQVDKKVNRVQVRIPVTSEMVGKYVALQIWDYFKAPKTTAYLMSTIIIGSHRNDYQLTMGPIVPAVATEAGFTKLSFTDDFDSLSTIDTAFTGSAGFKWYPQMPWHKQQMTTSEYSVTNSVLTINPNHRNFNYDLATANPQNGVGQTFGHGYYEACMRWSFFDVPTKNAEGSSWPSFWSLSLPYLRQTKKPYRELDFMESMGNNTDLGTVWDWQDTDSPAHRFRNVSPSSIQWNGTTTSTLPNGMTTTDWHVYGCLWQPGIIQWTLDGQVIRSFTWNGTTTSGAIDGNGNKPAPGQGLFTQFNDPTADMTVVLGTGTGRPFDVDWVHIWTK